MYKVWLYLLFLGLAATQVLAQGCGPQNPNCIVPTRPPGDSTNAAASTAFVTQSIGGPTTSLLTSNNTWSGTNTWTNTTSMSGPSFFSGITSFAGAVHFDNSIPWLDLDGCSGAISDAGPAPDFTTPMQNCINAFETAYSAGEIRLNTTSGSDFCVYGGLTIHNLGMTLKGAGREATSISTCGHDATVLTLQGGSSVMDISLQGIGYKYTTFNVYVVGSSHYTLNCVSCQRIQNVQIRGGNGVLDQEGDIHIVNNVDISDSYGNPGALMTWRGGCWAYGNKFDQNWPAQTGTNVTLANWISNHVYNTGDIFELPASQTISQVTSGGTSGTVAPLANNYGISVTDGTAVEQLALPLQLDGEIFDTGASECAEFQTDHTGAFNHSINFLNTLAGAPPQYINLTDITFSQSLNSTINIANGHGIWIRGSHGGGCIGAGCAGVNISTNFTSDAKITDVHFLTPGIAALTASVGSGLLMANNSELDATTYGVLVSGTATNFDIHDNYFTHSCTISPGTGRLVNNVGCNADFAAPLVITGSPMTYTTSVRAESINVTATTSIGSIVVGGTDILNGALGANVHYPFNLGPNTAATITYTGTLSGSHILH